MTTLYLSFNISAGEKGYKKKKKKKEKRELIQEKKSKTKSRFFCDKNEKWEKKI